MDRPLVSIVVPSYNQGKYIRATIDSILNQEYRPIEVLVLDGGSRDETVDVLRSYADRAELKWWSERDRGVVDAVNKGLDRAAGEILAIQSSDDLYLPGAIAAAVEALADGEAGLVYGEVEYIDEASKVTGTSRQAPWSLHAYVGKEIYVPQPAAFFTKKAADTCGRWREEISFAADAEFYLRIGTRFGVRSLEVPIAQYRYHAEQRDKAPRRIPGDWEGAIRAWIAETNPPARLRRQALSGIHMTRWHYLPEEDWWPRSLEVTRALILAPWRFLEPGFPRRELIPGRWPVKRALSRLKRAVGFSPRRG